MKIILYTTHCPQCKLVEMLLNKNNLEFEENTNIEEMKSLGITSVPVLSIDGKLYDTRAAVSFLSSYKSK